jgi:hypothetical protein
MSPTTHGSMAGVLELLISHLQPVLPPGLDWSRAMPHRLWMEASCTQSGSVVVMIA